MPLTVFAKYIDLKVQAGPARQGGYLEGYLGQFDSDTDPTSDLVSPDEALQTASYSGEFLKFLMEIFNAWRIDLQRSMLA